MPGPHAQPTVLTDGDLVLREPEPRHREAFVSLADDDRLFTYMMIRFTRADMDGWFTTWQSEISAPDRSYWPLVIELAGTPTGFTMLSTSSPKVAELQWYVSPVYWGRGGATRATPLALAFAFERLGFHRVFATADPLNESSVRVLEGAAFRREGYMRDYVLTHAGWRDRLMFGLLEDEWRGT